MLNLQAGAITSYSTPKRNENRPRPYTNLDDFDICVVHRTIYEFYIHEKMVPTVKAVLMKLQETIGYKGQQSSLFKIFKALGFRWKKIRDNTRILIEKQDVRRARVAFFYKQLLDFAETVMRLYIATKHTSIAPTPQTWRGLIILPRDTWHQPLWGNG
jgi:hypothetical protein